MTQPSYQAVRITFENSFIVTQVNQLKYVGLESDRYIINAKTISTFFLTILYVDGNS
jgi:hypothetical protein